MSSGGRRAGSGQKPLPTELKKLTGVRNSRINKNEPKADNINPEGIEIPNWMPEEAIDEFYRISRVLSDSGLLTELDETAMLAYCVSYGLFVRAMRLANDTDIVIKVGEKPVRNPAVREAGEQMKLMYKWMVEFGMTPSSRGRIGVKYKEAENEMEKLLNEIGVPA